MDDLKKRVLKTHRKNRIIFLIITILLISFLAFPKFFGVNHPIFTIVFVLGVNISFFITAFTHLLIKEIKKKISLRDRYS